MHIHVRVTVVCDMSNRYAVCRSTHPERLWPLRLTSHQFYMELTTTGVHLRYLQYIHMYNVHYWRVYMSYKCTVYKISSMCINVIHIMYMYKKSNLSARGQVEGVGERDQRSWPSTAVNIPHPHYNHDKNCTRHCMHTAYPLWLAEYTQSSLRYIGQVGSCMHVYISAESKPANCTQED